MKDKVRVIIRKRMSSKLFANNKNDKRTIILSVIIIIIPVFFNIELEGGVHRKKFKWMNKFLCEY
jgi:hypothetical protein